MRRWPSKNMFLSIPRQLESGESVSISGTVNGNPESLSIYIIESNENADDHWQFAAHFNENTVPDGENGTLILKEQIPATDLLIRDTDKLKFKLELRNVDNMFIRIVSHDNYFVADIETSLYDIDTVALGGVNHVDRILYRYGSPLDGRLPITKVMNNDTQNVIILSGTIETTPNSISIGLGTDGEIACQVDVNFNENQLNINSMENSTSTIFEQSELISDSHVSLSFVFDKNYNLDENYLNIKTNNSFIHQEALRHNIDDIDCIILNGDKCITTLDFQFDTWSTLNVLRNS